LRGTLGTLLRTTLAQAGVVREVLERGAREGRSRIDGALSSRRRSDALADLGEAVLDLIRRGEIDVDEIPEVRDIVAHLDELDAGHPDEHDAPPASAPARSRFDSRRRDEDDGTVSSASRWLPAKKPAPRGGVWRPPVDSAVERPADEITAREAPKPRKAAVRKGGISFDNDDDADLADYMHPDDVPVTTPPAKDPKDDGGA
jgi:hypothetical protein